MKLQKVQVHGFSNFQPKYKSTYKSTNVQSTFQKFSQSIYLVISHGFEPSKIFIKLGFLALQDPVFDDSQKIFLKILKKKGYNHQKTVEIIQKYMTSTFS